MKVAIYIMLAALALSACGCASTEDPQEKTTITALYPIKTPHFDAVVVPPDKARVLGLWTRRPISGYWMPTDIQLFQAERFIRAYVTENERDKSKVIDEHKRQYYGIVEGDQKIIFCYFIRHTEHFPNWKSEPVIVVDKKGEDVWALEYNIETHACAIWHRPEQTDDMLTPVPEVAPEEMLETAAAADDEFIF